MINRLDNICEAVLKGKWPVNRRQMFDFQGLVPGYTPSTMDSPLQKRSLAELSMVSQASISGSEDITTSPQLSKVGHYSFLSCWGTLWVLTDLGACAHEYDLVLFVCVTVLPVIGRLLSGWSPRHSSPHSADWPDLKMK